MHLGEVWEEFWYGVRKRDKIIVCLNIFLWSTMNASIVYFTSKFTSYLDNKKMLLSLIIAYIIFIIVFEVDEFIGDWANDYIWEMMSVYTARYWLKELYHTSPKSIKDLNSGYVSGLLNNHLSSKREVLNSFLLGIVSIVSLFYSLFIYYSIHQYLFISTAAVCLVAIMIRVLTTGKIVLYQKPFFKIQAECRREFMEASNNLSTVQKLRLLDFFMTRIDKVEKDLDRNYKPLEMWAEGIFCVYKLIMYMLLPVDILVCIYMNQEGIVFDFMGAVSYIVTSNITMVHNLKYLYGMQKAIIRYSETYSQLTDVSKVKDSSYVIDFISNFNKIEMTDVTFTYNNSLSSIHIPSFVINKGDFIAVSGESGQGKTTMLNILAGGLANRTLYVDSLPYKGNINPIYIAQDVEMFDMSLRDNLKLGDESIDDSIIIHMLDAVGMSKWLSQQKDGLDVVLGERGVKVSTGQRQRLNLIRGLLREGELYFLDEPTSNVDEYTEMRIIELIKEQLAGKTVIIVTHRPAIKNICNKEYEFINNKLLLKN